ncbi:MAG: DUF3581 family protein [Halofilum sp. (in: g-proteobacteria)]|nr:DUF3581 family protein [Halofilum sp. (in: g-proteobacteria)]
MNDASSFLAPYHHAEDGRIRVTAEQGSRFAKDVAGDHNPLHDVGARRFCVPGDLLCALALARYGLSTDMTFRFRDMVGPNEAVYFPDSDEERIALRGEQDGVFLEVERAGEVTFDDGRIEPFVREYVAFSGKTFPHYMIPVLREKGVMFHPERPFVIYDSMGFDLETFDFERPEPELSGIELAVDGKRGDTVLRFEFRDGGRTVGAGWKKLVIGGLRPYDEDRMQSFVEEFNRRKDAYEAERDERSD